MDELARSSIESGPPASGPLEVAPSLSRPLYNSAGPSQADTRRAVSLDTQTPFLSVHGSQQPTRLTSQDAAYPMQKRNSFGYGQQQHNQQQQFSEPAAVDGHTHTQTEAYRMLQRIQRSSSDTVTDKLANSLPGSLSSAEGAAFQRPAGSLGESGMVGKNSNSSISSSIFGESNQWVIDYNDLVSEVNRCNLFVVLCLFVCLLSMLLFMSVCFVSWSSCLAAQQPVH